MNRVKIRSHFRNGDNVIIVVSVAPSFPPAMTRGGGGNFLPKIRKLRRIVEPKNLSFSVELGDHKSPTGYQFGRSRSM